MGPSIFAGIFILTLFISGLLSDYPPCTQQTDCKANECCINKDRPIGKRDVHAYCFPLGTVNSSCYVRYGSASSPPDHLVFGCPCTKPLICKGIGVYDIPLGEVGYCEPSL